LTAVWVRDLATGRERRIADRAHHPVISADGRKLAFSRGPLRGLSIFVSLGEGETPRKLCDGCGYAYQWFAGDTKLLVDHADPRYHQIKVFDVAAGQGHVVLQDPRNAIFVPHLSPDEKWISFTMITGDRKRRIYVAPFDAARETPESDWIIALDGENLERQPFWPPVGDLVYFLSDRDGFRCVWAIRLDKTTRKASGDAFPVQHFHDIRYTMIPFTDPTDIGLSLNTDSMFLSLYEARANVWLAEERASR
jgi:eukaryotic-like serine/threonine-protein kinase